MTFKTIGIVLVCRRNAPTPGLPPDHEHLGVERDEFRRIPFVQIAAIMPIELAEPLHQRGSAPLPQGVV